MKIFSRLLDIIGIPGDIQTIIALFGLPFVVAVANTAVAFISRIELHWVIMSGIGTAAFAVTLLYFVIRIYRENTIFQNMRVHRTEIIGAYINSQTQTMQLVFKAFFRNTGFRSLYFKVVRVHLALQGRTNPDPQLNDRISLLQAQNEASFQFAGIDGLDITNPIGGRMEIEILYGSKENDLRYRLSYCTQPSLIMPINPVPDENGRGVFTLLNPITKNLHEKSRWL